MEPAEALSEIARRCRAGALDAVLIAGPTASGKSALALALAETLGGTVVNADSMQVYADLRVLSARPTRDEEARVPHRLYGIVPAARAYSVGDYLRDAAPVLADLKRAGRVAVIVGGTGLYFRALTTGLAETPVVPQEVRERVEGLARHGADLHAELARRDPEAAARLSPADSPRIQRALEVFEATGTPISRWWQSHQSVPLLAPGRWQGLFLNPSRDALFARIDARFREMMGQGALEEVRHLATLGLAANRGVMKAHGLPHLVAHLAGALDLDEAIRLGQRDTRRYAKRQLTWARKFMPDWIWAESVPALGGLVPPA
ncbi:MAG TPA: tRNA (adenosine(37)-N6)-dimethylallyltransferase MiaA [Beijerinckiaceae bacterium]|nr:tRNA (adenosine(37)-N6)-dimethylallyltransferase MiaA [Beijerinckiaceae bacterium]